MEGFGPDTTGMLVSSRCPQNVCLAGLRVKDVTLPLIVAEGENVNSTINLVL